jgi:PTS system nitrogen regulatory IIA component
MHFGATLRLLRVDAGLTLRELADRVGVSNAYLSRVENGHDAPPTPDRLTAIARAFGLPATALVELADRVSPVAADYFETVPGARDLMMEIVRRRLTPVQVARVRAFVEREFPSARPGRGTPDVDVTESLDRTRVVLGLACTHLDDVLDIAATRLASPDGPIRATQIAQVMLERERACSSALGAGVAVPHALMRGIEPRAVVVALRRPLALDTPDGAGVHLFLVHVHSGGPSHTRMLARLARLADPALVQRLVRLGSPSEVVRMLAERLG